MSRKLQKIQKMLIILDNPKTSKTKCQKSAFIDFENGVIVKIYKFFGRYHFNLGALAPPLN